jgi:hypothetical protein
VEAEALDEGVAQTHDVERVVLGDPRLDFAGDGTVHWASRGMHGVWTIQTTKFVVKRDC